MLELFLTLLLRVGQVAQKINYAKNLYDEVQQTVKLETKEPSTPT